MTVAAPTPSDPPTQLLPAGPVSSSGALSPGYAVGSTTAGEQCGSGSDVGIAGAYRCFTGNGVYDPCFADATPDEVLCVNDPFTRTAVRLTLAAGALPASGGGDPRALWGLVLTGGVRCTALQGAHDQVDGVAVDFACTDGTQVLRDIDSSGTTWIATQVRYASGSYQHLPAQAITTAYYGRG